MDQKPLPLQTVLHDEVKIGTLSLKKLILRKQLFDLESSFALRLRHEEKIKKIWGERDGSQ